MNTMKSHELAKLLLQYPNKPIYTTDDNSVENLNLYQINGIDFGLTDVITISNGIQLNYLDFNTDNNIILIDCDGVLLKWGSKLNRYASINQIKIDTSKTDKELYCTPNDVFLCDTDESLELLHDYHKTMLDKLERYIDTNALYWTECKFVVVTAIGTDPEIIKLRWENLQKYFEGKVIDLLCCEPNESKINLFKKAKELYGNRIKAYVDDLPHHLTDCKTVLDIPCYHMVRGDNTELSGDWKSIKSLYEIKELEIKNE